jgi:hypothetical protein
MVRKREENKSVHRHFLGILLLFGITLTVNLSAQSNSLTPFHSGLTSNWSWSSDSQHFVFDDITNAPPNFEYPSAPIYSGPYWYDFDVNTNTLSRSSIWSLQPNLTNDQFVQFEIVGGDLNTQSFVFAGPSGLIAYVAVALADSRANPIGITDGENYVIASDTYLRFAFSDLSNFIMRWNDVGSAVAGFNNLGNVQIISYITNFGSPHKLQIPIGANYVNPIPERLLVIPNLSFPPIFDLANDSDEVLMLVEEGEINNPDVILQPNLILWHPLNPENSIVLDSLKNRGITASAFNQNNDNQILFLDATGLYLFDRTTETILLLTSDFTSSTADRALFSPNGVWLALGQGANHYMLNVADFLPVDVAN